jgi:hypothetical protein
VLATPGDIVDALVIAVDADPALSVSRTLAAAGFGLKFIS